MALWKECRCISSSLSLFWPLLVSLSVASAALLRLLLLLSCLLLLLLFAARAGQVADDRDEQRVLWSGVLALTGAIVVVVAAVVEGVLRAQRQLRWLDWEEPVPLKVRQRALVAVPKADACLVSSNAITR